MKINYKNNLSVSLLIVLFIFIQGCAPKIEDKKTRTETLARGPHFYDTDLSKFGLQAFAEKSFSQSHLQYSTDTALQLQVIEAEFSIGQITHSSLWKSNAVQAYAQFAKNQNFAPLKTESSVYLDIVDRQINKSVGTSITSAEQQLQKNLNSVSQLIRILKEKYLTLKPQSLLQEKLQLTKVFINRIISNVATLDIMSEFKNLLIQQLKEKSTTSLSEADLLDNRMSRAESISQVIESIDRYVINIKTKLPDEDTKNLALGRTLGQLVDQIVDDKSALRALALVWSALDEQQRIDYVQAANASLYKFFNSKNESKIQCLISSECNGLITTIALNIGVYPALKTFGIDNIKNLLNQKGKEFILTKVNQVASTSLQNLGETIISQVHVSVHEKRDDLDQFNKNLNSILKNNLQKYFLAKNITELSGPLLNEKNKVAHFDQQNLLIRNKINLLNEIPENSKNDFIKNQYEILEQSLRLTEFSQAPDSLQELSDSQRVDLILNPVQRQYFNEVPNTTTMKRSVLLNDQSEFLLTTAKLLQELTDWKESSFDQNLSTIQANEIITEFKTADLNRPFFAKSDLFALILSLTSQTLKLLQDTYSPLILIDNNQKVILIQEFNENHAPPLALAAASDFLNGTRSTIIKANDLARFQIALIEFYSATAGLEKTNSEVLRKMDATGQTLLNQIIEARKKIKALIVATGNFISNQLLQKNGLVLNKLQLPINSLDKDFNLTDQTLAVEALVRTYELTDIDVYLWSALDIYYAMNAHLYNLDLKFYNLNLSAARNGNENQVDSSLILNSYKNLLFLKPYLSSDSQDQFENIFAGWLENF